MKYMKYMNISLAGRPLPEINGMPRGTAICCVLWVRVFCKLPTYKILTEGSLEVKLPTMWTNGKAEVGRVREEKSRREKIREEKEKR